MSIPSKAGAKRSHAQHGQSAPPWRCPSSAPVPPQGAPGGSGRRPLSGGDAGPLGAQPLPRVLEPAASKVADCTALAIQVDHRHHRHRCGRALGGRPDSAEVLRLPAEKEEESSQGGKGEGLQGGIELLGRLHSMRCLGSASPVSGTSRCSWPVWDLHVRASWIPSQTWEASTVGATRTRWCRVGCVLALSVAAAR